MRSVSEEQFRTWGHGLRQADANSFAELFDATYDPLHRYAMYITRDSVSASDILQDVFPAVFSYLFDDPKYKSLRAPQELVESGRVAIVGLSVTNGHIVGGAYDGEPLFDSARRPTNRGPVVLQPNQ